MKDHDKDPDLMRAKIAKDLKHHIPLGVATGKTLEEAFFAKENERLAKRYLAIRKMAESKEALSKVSGIKNELVLDTLMSMNVKPEILATIRVVPLVAIAWADGQVDKEAKKAVLLAVTESSFAKGKTNYELVKHWLDNKPSDELLDTWEIYIGAICSNMSETDVELFRKEVLDKTEEIALATGSFLGFFGSISPAEGALLKRFEKAFKK